MMTPEILSKLQTALSTSPIASLHNVLKTLDPYANVPKGRKRLESKIIQVMNERYDIYGERYITKRIERLGR